MEQLVKSKLLKDESSSEQQTIIKKINIVTEILNEFSDLEESREKREKTDLLKDFLYILKNDSTIKIDEKVINKIKEDLNAEKQLQTERMEAGLVQEKIKPISKQILMYLLIYAGMSANRMKSAKRHQFLLSYLILYHLRIPINYLLKITKEDLLKNIETKKEIKLQNGNENNLTGHQIYLTRIQIEDWENLATHLSIYQNSINILFDEFNYKTLGGSCRIKSEKTETKMSPKAFIKILNEDIKQIIFYIVDQNFLKLDLGQNPSEFPYKSSSFLIRE